MNLLTQIWIFSTIHAPRKEAFTLAGVLGFFFPILLCSQLISADLTNNSNFQEVARYKILFSLGQGSNLTSQLPSTQQIREEGWGEGGKENPSSSIDTSYPSSVSCILKESFDSFLQMPAIAISFQNKKTHLIPFKETYLHPTTCKKRNLMGPSFSYGQHKMIQTCRRKTTTVT